MRLALHNNLCVGLEGSSALFHQCLIDLHELTAIIDEDNEYSVPIYMCSDRWIDNCFTISPIQHENYGNGNYIDSHMRHCAAQSAQLWNGIFHSIWRLFKVDLIDLIYFFSNVILNFVTFNMFFVDFFVFQEQSLLSTFHWCLKITTILSKMKFFPVFFFQWIKQLSILWPKMAHFGSFMSICSNKNNSE